MARPIRIEYTNAVYHITARGNERKKIFRDDAERFKFLELLEKYTGRHGVILYCYVLMGNHYHLVVETPNSNLAKFMHDLQSHYTGYFNRKHKRNGHLFQGRYKALVVEKDAYLVVLSRYVHLNPVRAGVTERPGQWPWSSYKDYIKPRAANKWLDRQPVLDQFGKRLAEACVRYRKYVEAGIGADLQSPVDSVKSQMILGDGKFVEKMRKLVEAYEHTSDTSDGKELFRWNRERADEAIETISRRYGVDPGVLKAKKRRGNIPRDVAIWLFHGSSRWTMKEIGEEFGISYGAAGKAAKRVEIAAGKDSKLSKVLYSLKSQFPA